jgi:hypothetical protein
MSAISAVSSGTSFISKPVKTCRWTDVKVKQAWLYSLSGIAMTSAVVALGYGVEMSSIALLGATIPLAAVAAAAAIYSRSLIDYEDPRILASLREDAAHMDLQQVVKKHGWMRLFRYSLLDAPHFQSAYCAYANMLLFTDILALYHAACSGRKEAGVRGDRFVVPKPVEWKNKFDCETQSLSCLKIIDRYAIKDLQKFGIITLTQRKILDTAEKKRMEFNLRESELERQFRDATPMQHAVLSRDIEIAELNYRSHPAHALLLQIDRDERREIVSVSASCDSKICHERQCLEEFRQHLSNQSCKGLTSEDLSALNCHERKMNEAVHQFRCEEAAAIGRIRCEYEFRRSEASQLLSAARQLMNRSIAAAEEQFRIATLPERCRIDELHEHNQACFCAQMNQLDKDYHRAGCT